MALYLYGRVFIWSTYVGAVGMKKKQDKKTHTLLKEHTTCCKHPHSKSAAVYTQIYLMKEYSIISDVCSRMSLEGGDWINHEM